MSNPYDLLDQTVEAKNPYDALDKAASNPYDELDAPVAVERGRSSPQFSVTDNAHPGGAAPVGQPGIISGAVDAISNSSNNPFDWMRTSGNLAKSFLTDVFAGHVQPSPTRVLPDFPNTAEFWQRGAAKDFQPSEFKSLPAVAKGVADTGAALPQVGIGTLLTWAGVPAPLAFGGVMGAQTFSDREDLPMTERVTEAAKSGAVGAVMPSVSEFGAKVGGDALLKLAAKTGANDVTMGAAQTIGKTLGSQSMLNALMLASQSPELIQQSQTDPAAFKESLIKLVAGNLAFEVPHIPELAREGLARNQVDAYTQSPEYRAKVDDVATHLLNPQSARWFAENGAKDSQQFLHKDIANVPFNVAGKDKVDFVPESGTPPADGIEVMQSIRDKVANGHQLNATEQLIAEAMSESGGDMDKFHQILQTKRDAAAAAQESPDAGGQTTEAATQAQPEQRSVSAAPTVNITDDFLRDLQTSMRGNQVTAPGVDKSATGEQSAGTAATSPETSTVRTASGIDERTGSVPLKAGMTAEEGSGRNVRFDTSRSDVAADYSSQESPPSAQSQSALPKSSRADAERPPDIIDLIANEHGKVRLSSAREIREGYKPKNAARSLFSESGMGIDEITDNLRRSGQLPEGATEDDLLQHIDDAAEARKGWRKKFYGDERQLNTEARQQSAWERETNRPGKLKVPLVPDDLNEGDKFTVKGAEVRVKQLHFDENKEVIGATLEDGKLFGRREVDAGTALQVDKGSLVRQEATAPRGNAPFSLSKQTDATPEGFGPTDSGDWTNVQHMLRGESTDQAVERLVGYQVDNGRVKVFKDGDLWVARVSQIEGKPRLIKSFKKQQVLNEAFTELFPNTKLAPSKSGNAGSDIRFAKSDEDGSRSAPSPTLKADVEAAVRPFSESMPSAKVRVIQSEAELPEHLQRQIKSQGAEGRVEGVFDPETGTVHLVADNLESPERARQVFFHEVVAHDGLRRLFGDRFDDFTDKVFAGHWDSPEMRSVIDDYGLDVSRLNDRRIAADEFAARLAEDPSKNPTLWTQIVAYVKAAWRKVAGGEGISEEEIRVALAKSRRGLEAESNHQDTKTPRFALKEREGAGDDESLARKSTTAVQLSQPMALRFGKRSNEVIGVNSFEEAGRKWDEIRDRHGFGASESPEVTVIDTRTGKELAKVSYNGRVWNLDGTEIPRTDNRGYGKKSAIDVESARFSLGAKEDSGRPEWLSKAQENEIWQRARDFVKAGDTPDHAMRAALAELQSMKLRGYDNAEAIRWAASLKPMLEEVRGGKSEARNPKSETNSNQEKSEIQNEDGHGPARTDTDSAQTKPEWQRLREQVDVAAEKLQQAIREHGQPGKFGKTKSQTLAAKNLAGAEYRNLRAELYENPDYVAAVLKEHDAVLHQLKGMAADDPRRSELEFTAESLRTELGNVQPGMLNRIFEKTFPDKVEKRSAPEIAAEKNLEDVTTEERRQGEAPADDVDELPETPAKRMIAELPGRVREVFDTARALQRKAVQTIRAKDARDVISYTKDAAETIGARVGKQAGNLVRHELNRAFGEKDINTRNDVREWALTTVLESGMDREVLAEHRRGLEASENARSVDGRRWLQAARYAERNWERLVKVAETYKKITDTENAVENEAGIPTLHRENYVFHLQDISPKWANTELSGGGSGPSAPFKHIRDHATYADAIAAGVKPKSLNAIDLLEHRVSLGRKLVGYRAWIESLGNVIDPGSDKAVVTAPIIRKRSDGTQDVTAPAGYHLENFAGQQFAVHSGFEGLFSALTGESGLKGAGWQAYLKTAQTSKHLLLLVDTYHLGRLAYFSAFARGAGEGFKAWLPGVPGFKRGLSILDNTIPDLRAMAERGDIPKEWLDGIIEDRRLLDGLLSRGLNVGHVVDNLYADWIRNLPVFGDINRFIFDKFQRGTMAEAALIELKRQIKANPTMAEEAVMRQVAKQVNTRFGNLGSQGVIKSKTANDIARMIFLAPQWNASLITSELKAYKQLGFDLPKAVLQGKATNVQLLGRAAAAAVVTQLLANQIINYMTRGHSTFENEEEGVGAKLSAWIPDVVGSSAGYFLNPLTLPTEMASYFVKSLERTGDITKSGKEFLSGRLHTGSRAVMTGFTREDEMGAKLRGGNEVAAHMAMSLVPVPLSTSALLRAGKQLVTRKPEEEFPGQYQKQLAQTFGLKLDMAPTAEQRVRNLASEFNKKHSVVPNAEFFHGPYYFIDRAALVGNTRNLDAEVTKVLESKTPKEIYEHYKRWIAAPFTGSRKREGEFYSTLSAEQKAAYEKARASRQKLAQSILEALPRVTAKQGVSE
jgi:hypothetical protein